VSERRPRHSLADGASGYVEVMSDHHDHHDHHDQDVQETDGQVSEVANLDPARAATPIVDGDATAGYPTSESGDAQEPGPEAGPNGNPHRDQDTH
jgi:hypothetical protein